MAVINIIKRINEEKLNKKLAKNIKNKYIEGEQWFRNPDLWYELTAFSNPYITIYSELVLLIQNIEKIYKHLKDKTLVFYGLGTGDTEIILVNQVLSKEKSADIIGIEVQEQFIKGFVQSLENIEYEDKNYKINFVGINDLFQDINKKDLKINNKKQAHIMLGNTLGNFNEKEIFYIFNKLMSEGDVLLMGFQTNNNLQKIFKQYSENKMFNRFIKKAILDSKELVWKLNNKESQIEAWSEDVLIFHSKKKNPKRVIKDAKKFGFQKIFNINDKNSAIQIFEKLKWQS